MIKGVDLSEHNGNVDIRKLKENGIEFAILRAGYGKNKSQIDRMFYNNYKKAKENNLPIGVYWYSYATNIDDAKKEAEVLLEVIDGLILEYPIFIDMEDADGYKAKRNVSDNMCVDICETFCNIIENAGYYTGIYANLDWLNNKLNKNKLDKFDKWVAQWGKKCTYKYKYGMWQFTNSGKIDGITSKLDFNYALYDYKKIIKENNLNKVKNCSTEYKYYQVKEGDTLSSIAQKYNTTWNEIYNKNKSIIGNNPNLIQIGIKLII